MKLYNGDVQVNVATYTKAPYSTLPKLYYRVYYLVSGIQLKARNFIHALFKYGRHNY